MAKEMRFGVLLDFYGDLLTDKQQDLMRLYYEEDLSLSEISENEGITRQGVHDAIRRSEAVLQEMEDKLGLAARFEKINRSADQIDDLAKKILDENNTYCYSADLTEQANRILELTKKLREEF